VDDATLRRVEAELNALNATGEELHRHSDQATYRPGDLVSPDRIRFQRRLLDELIADGEGDIAKDGTGSHGYHNVPNANGTGHWLGPARVSSPAPMR